MYAHIRISISSKPCRIPMSVKNGNGEMGMVLLLLLLFPYSITL